MKMVHRMKICVFLFSVYVAAQALHISPSYTTSKPIVKQQGNDNGGIASIKHVAPAPTSAWYTKHGNERSNSDVKTSKIYNPALQLHLAWSMLLEVSSNIVLDGIGNLYFVEWPNMLECYSSGTKRNWVSSADHGLIAINPKGTHVYTTYISGPANDDDTADRSVYAMDTATGDVVWKTSLGASAGCDRSLTVSASGNTVICAADYYTQVFNTTDGTLLWSSSRLGSTTVALNTTFLNGRDDGSIYVNYLDGLYKLDIQTGDVMWVFNTSTTTGIVGPVVGPHGRVFQSSKGKLRSYFGDSGDEAWTHSLHNRNAVPFAVDDTGTTYIISVPDEVSSSMPPVLEAIGFNGELVWSATLYSSANCSVAVAGEVIIAGCGLSIAAYTRADGTKMNEIKGDFSCGTDSFALGADGTLYCSMDPYAADFHVDNYFHLHAFGTILPTPSSTPAPTPTPTATPQPGVFGQYRGNAQHTAFVTTPGSRVWIPHSYVASKVLDFPVVLQPIVWSNLVIFVDADGSGGIVAMRTDATIVWNLFLSVQIVSSPVVTTGGILGVPLANSTILALRVQDGTFLWSVSCVTPLDPLVGLFISATTYYEMMQARPAFIVGSSGSLALHDASTGKVVQLLDSSIINVAYPAVDGFGNVYAVDLNGTLQAFGSGKPMWAVQDALPIAPVLFQGTVYFAATDTYLHAVDTSSGQSLWTAYVGFNVSCAPTVDESSGNIYHIGQSGIIRAFSPNGQRLWTVDIFDCVETGSSLFVIRPSAGETSYILVVCNQSTQVVFGCLDATNGTVIANQTTVRVTALPAITTNCDKLHPWACLILLEGRMAFLMQISA